MVVILRRYYSSEFRIQLKNSNFARIYLDKLLEAFHVCKFGLDVLGVVRVFSLQQIFEFQESLHFAVGRDYDGVSRDVLKKK